MRIGIVALSLGLASCAHVHAWERGHHADESMTFGADAEESAPVDHAVAYREGASPPAASGGGGCGCN